MKRPMQEKVIAEWIDSESCEIAKHLCGDSGNPCKGCMGRTGGKLTALVPVPIPDGMVEAKVGEKIDKRWMRYSESKQEWVYLNHSLGCTYETDCDGIAIRPDYPDPGEGYRLIVAEDMPGDEKIGKGYGCFDTAVTPHAWDNYSYGVIHTWGETRHKYFRERVEPVEPPTFAEDYGTQRDAATALAANTVSGRGYRELEYIHHHWVQADRFGRIQCLSMLVLGNADMTTIRWKPSK